MADMDKRHAKLQRGQERISLAELKAGRMPGAAAEASPEAAPAPSEALGGDTEAAPGAPESTPSPATQKASGPVRGTPAPMVYEELPDTVGEMLSWMRILIVLGSVGAVLIRLWPGDDAAFWDAVIFMGLGGAFVGLVAAAAGWLLTAILAPVLERFLPHGGGRWVRPRGPGRSSQL